MSADPRGTRQQRGYDIEHDRLRALWQARIDAGDAVRCARCLSQIHQGMAWHLGHKDGQRAYSGPEHPACNLRARNRYHAGLREPEAHPNAPRR